MNKTTAIKTVCIITLIFIQSIAVSSSALHNINVANSTRQTAHADGNPENHAKPVIYHQRTIDKDLNRIQDSLENIIAQALTNKSAEVPVVATLFNPASNQDLQWFSALGGRVTYIYRYVTYGFAGVIPAVNVTEFALLEKENLAMLEYDAPLRYHLDVSVPLARVRPMVWDTYGLNGSSNHSIAILDTGIDDSHLDVGPFGDLNFSKKIVGWYDATSDQSSTPQDYGEHGTHVAGIAAGTGAANALQGSAMIETTFTYILPSKPAGPWVYGYVDYIDVMNPGVINLNCSWSGDNDVLLVLSDPAGNEVKRTSGTTQPLILAYDTTGKPYPTGRYEAFVGNAAGPSGTPFSCVETYPYEGRNDSHNLFTGVAPNSKLVGVKVFDNTGTGYLSNLTAGMDWIVQNRLTYHIAVASMSVGLENGVTDTTLDQKADTMVNYGIVTTVSAGNDFEEGYTIGSPGTAAYVITVAATNDQNGVTSYSSNGDTLKNEYGLIKPDVAAPGGTFQPQYGNKIISADSNDVDASYSGYSDRNVNDYQQMAGTSMSTPYVAGLAALLVQALGDWHWTQDEALKVKMLISMTALETQTGEGSNVPPLNRGEKDHVEGYGRTSADAAIEAATMTYDVGESATSTFGADPADKKVWARKVSLSADTAYGFRLTLPAGADYDLYLYSGNPDDYGQPVILEKSTNATQGANESFWYTPTYSGTYYIVVKWVSGNGAFDVRVRDERDVAVVSITPSASEVYSGRTVNITVVAKNEGAANETFEVALYRGTVFVEKKSVTNLPPEASSTLTFNWNTSDVPPADYVVSATASSVPGETDLGDNYLTNIIHVKIPGDVNGDRKVNIHDAAALSAHWYPGPPVGPLGYDPNADVNNDGGVDMEDVGVMNANWLRSE